MAYWSGVELRTCDLMWHCYWVAQSLETLGTVSTGANQRGCSIHFQRNVKNVWTLFVVIITRWLRKVIVTHGSR